MISFKLNEKLHKQILINKGREYIHVKTMEEISELISALSCKVLNIDNLAEEICDVYIYLYRIKNILPERNIHVSNKMNNCNIKTSIYYLSSTIRCISKGCLNHTYTDECYKSISNVYNILESIIDRYNLYRDVQQWIYKKEERDIRIYCKLK